MNRMLINSTQREELRVALVENQQLYDLDLERLGKTTKKSNIYKGKITRIEPSLEAAFVDYGAERHGFLPLKEIAEMYYVKPQNNNENERLGIKELIRENQEILVQIVKEERGSKGAALTTFISLAGCYLVLMPNNPKAGGISRRIAEDERESLRNILNELELPNNMGVIVRTAGVGKTKEELQWDLNILLCHWEAIKKAASEKDTSHLIHQEGDVVIRAIRDYLRQEISEILIDNAETFSKARQYIQQVRPDFLNRVKLYQDNIPLFTRFHIESQIETAFLREVQLPSGGAIVIDNTEAMVAIDINSGRDTKGLDIEETALNTNLEAADEIARQLRLRDIGGLIVIDFIDMSPVRNQREVENRLREALRMDRARVQIGRISRFGLLEMSRQRLKSTLGESVQQKCPHCEGRGTIRSVESMTLSLIRLLEENAMLEHTAQLQLQVPVDVASYLINEKREAIALIEKRHKVSILILPNKHIELPRYHLKCLKANELYYTPPHSYEMVANPETEAEFRVNYPTETQEPAVKAIMSNMPTPQTPRKPGLVKRMWELLFGKKIPVQKTKRVRHHGKRPTDRKPQRKRYNRRPNNNNRSNQSKGKNYYKRNDNAGNKKYSHRGQRSDDFKKSPPAKETQSDKSKLD
ncbi:MAG: Rne/Rng family ribonuclease [Pseudomonadota bacterium]